MEKYLIHPQWVVEYERVLGLHWPVVYWLVPDEMTCRVLCDGKAKLHEIWINGTTYDNLDNGLPDIVHELCHCALAERIDSAFSTVLFTEEWNKNADRDSAKFNQLARMLYFAWSHVDIWVNDLRFAHWPNLALQDQTTFANIIIGFVKRQRFEIFEKPEILLGLAQYQAERSRCRSNSPDLFSFLRVKKIAVDKQILELAKHFELLPRLEFNAEKDLKVLEQSVQETAKLLNLSIKPRLVWENKWVWSLD